MFQKLFLGSVTKEENRNLKDVNWREIVVLVPLLILIFWIGLYPKPFFDLMGPTVDSLVAGLQTAVTAGLP
jgi:NADH-quinone oxidoreductase subunit M